MKQTKKKGRAEILKNVLPTVWSQLEKGKENKFTVTQTKKNQLPTIKLKTAILRGKKKEKILDLLFCRD